MRQKSIIYSSQIPFEDSINLYRGIITASVIIGVWAVSLISLLLVNIKEANIAFLIAAVIWQTFLYTGLFITAHDAMHGTVCSYSIRINHFVGSLCLFLFAGLSYKTLLKKHWQHHLHPATKDDPDFHDGKHKNIIAWYFHFMKGYWSWQQLLTVMIIYNSVSYLLHVPQENLNLFWVIPSLLSSLQLFYFGTFEPHSEPANGYVNSNHTRTISRPIWLSFITCYHFGYHEEHHQYPNVPWWQLAKVHCSVYSQQFADVHKDKQADQKAVSAQ
jgi:beta-carotene/zeaxanthin 4-ketolase